MHAISNENKYKFFNFLRACYCLKKLFVMNINNTLKQSKGVNLRTINFEKLIKSTINIIYI